MNSNIPAGRVASKKGFSLVEVTLAMMVIGAGMLAVFALFPSGLEAANRASFETRASMFAEDVFNSYRALATESNVNYNAVPTHQVAIPVPTVWSNLPIIKQTGPPPAVAQPMVFKYNPGAGFPMIEELSLRYNLVFRKVMGYSPATELGWIMELYIWDGEFTPAGGNKLEEALYFFTQLPHQYQ